MIKVYLDWNCITHCKDSLSELYDLLKQYNHLFICPYGVPHLRDIQTNMGSNMKEYERDLDILTQICEGHMLSCCDDKIELLDILPRDYLLDSGEILDFLQNKLFFPYASMRTLFRTAFNPDDLQRIAMENNPKQVVPVANNILKNTLGINSIEDLMIGTRTIYKPTLEMKFKQDYYSLDMLNYKSEAKKKSFSNIDTDAQHIYLACFCDYLITNDKKMREKAQAIYNNNHCATQVMDPFSFIKEIPIIVDKCYDQYLIPNAMHTNGIPTIKEDGAHFKALEYPLWGAFKYCYNIAALNNSCSKNMAFFLPERFMFYDELRPIAVITSLCLPDSQRELHVQQYLESYINSTPIDNFAFSIDTPKYRYDCVLMRYNELPALQVRYTSKT